jgi:hypothetical protein
MPYKGGPMFDIKEIYLQEEVQRTIKDLDQANPDQIETIQKKLEFLFDELVKLQGVAK